MLKTMNTMDTLESEDVWFLAYYTYSNIWNYSDASEKLARDLAEAGAVGLLTFNLCREPYLSTVQSEKGSFLLEASLSILHNIARCSDVKHHFKENKTTEVIIPFITQQDELLRVFAMLTMAYIVEEEENSKLIDETGTILNIVQWIDKAVSESDERECQGCTPWELTLGLSKLAVNDANKIKIVESGALPVFLKMLLHGDPKEQSTVAQCIRTLSFNKNVRQKIVEQEGLVSALELLATSEHFEVKDNAQGALWIIKGENDPTTSCNELDTRVVTTKARVHVAKPHKATIGAVSCTRFAITLDDVSQWPLRLDLEVFFSVYFS